MYELKVISKFAAAHQLAMVTEKCENLHGHNWKIEVFVAGRELNRWGVLVDFGELKRHLSDVMDTLDHKFLNNIEAFCNINPSSENIAKYIADQMQSRLADLSIRISRVRVWESDDACATYIVP
jgi:6-pyruvoyltetrahydropterin/6-carboxytetrahydropterin synthase